MLIELELNILEKYPEFNANFLIYLKLKVLGYKEEAKKWEKLVNDPDPDCTQWYVDAGWTDFDWNPTDNAKALFYSDEDLMWEDFLNTYPSITPDGSRRLKTNRDNCKYVYSQITGNEKAIHDKILLCLKAEIKERGFNGKLGFMKNMDKWLAESGWKIYEEDLYNENKNILQSSFIKRL